MRGEKWLTVVLAPVRIFVGIITAITVSIAQRIFPDAASSVSAQNLVRCARPSSYQYTPAAQSYFIPRHVPIFLRMYTNFALFLFTSTVKHEFCSIFIRNAVKQGRSLTHVLASYHLSCSQSLGRCGQSFVAGRWCGLIIHISLYRFLADLLISRKGIDSGEQGNIKVSIAIICKSYSGVTIFFYFLFIVYFVYDFIINITGWWRQVRISHENVSGHYHSRCGRHRTTRRTRC